MFGTLTAFALRKFRKEKRRSRMTFKETKSKKDLDGDDDSNEFEVNFSRRLKKATNKYKGMLPLKYFRCRKIGHLASRYPKKVLDRSLRSSKRRLNM